MDQPENPVDISIHFDVRTGTVIFRQFIVIYQQYINNV